MDLMTLQDQIESFQKLIFNSFRGTANNECKISALVPLVKESFGIYKFITSMLRAMHRRRSQMYEYSEELADQQEPTRLMSSSRSGRGIPHNTLTFDDSTTSARISST